MHASKSFVCSTGSIGTFDFSLISRIKRRTFSKFSYKLINFACTGSKSASDFHYTMMQCVRSKIFCIEAGFNV